MRATVRAMQVMRVMQTIFFFDWSWWLSIISPTNKFKFSLGLVDEPVSLDGSESVACDYTELEMTAYDPVLRQNVKLVSVYVTKPSENLENVKLMVEVFDKAVNDALPSAAVENGITNVDYLGCGLDPKSYVGD